MSKEKKVSITNFDEIIKESQPDEIVVDFHSHDLKVRKFLSLAEMIRFVNEVVSGCFDDESGEYLPELKRIMIDRNIVKYYGYVNLPEDYEHLYEILTKTDIVDVIFKNINRRQYENIISAIDEKVEARIYSNEQMFASKINKAMASFDELSKSMEDMFKDMTPDEMKNILGALSNGVDEEKLVDAVIRHEAKEDGDSN